MIALSVLTGFLGSGKTTLLRRLLADRRMGETAVVVNEIGEVGLDHRLLRTVDGTIALLESGCLCCSMRDDLVETLDELRAKRERGTLPPFGRVVVETTGLADPAPVLHAVMTDRSLARWYRLERVVATLDATCGEAQLEQYPEAVQQVALADVVALTKTDLAPQPSREAVRERVRALNPVARVFEASAGDGPGPDDLFAGDALARAAPPRGDAAHAAGIESFALRFEEPLPRELLAEWLSTLLTVRGRQILRVKGIVRLVGAEHPVAIHGVGHVVYPPEPIADPAPESGSQIVFVTRDLPRAAVVRSFDEVRRAPWTHGRVIMPPG